jgi:hypothetical protein
VGDSCLGVLGEVDEFGVVVDEFFEIVRGL